MTAEQAKKRHPEVAAAISAIVDSLDPDYCLVEFDSVTPIEETDLNRMLDPYPLVGGGMSRRVEYTHRIRSRCAEHVCVHGISTEGEAHRWA